MTYRKLPKHDARKYDCSLFPWLKARHIHHTSYKGPERLYWDMLPLSVAAHWLIHGVAGGVLTMPKAVTRQNRIARRLPLRWLWKYPNPAQRLLHAWCRVPGCLRVAGILLGLIAYLAPGSLGL
jgi:hypothetical protein